MIPRLKQPRFKMASALTKGSKYAKLRAAVSAWRQSQAAVRVDYGGRTTFAQSGAVSGNNIRTYVGTRILEGIRQNGYIRSIVYDVAWISGVNNWKFKLFRPSGTDYVQVAETEAFTPPGTGIQTFVPAAPLGPCLPGDRVGLYLYGSLNQLNVSTQAGEGARYATGDLTTVSSTEALLSGYSLNIRFEGVPPFLIGTGDSIMEGHNQPPQWHTHYHNGPAGRMDASPLWQLCNLIPDLEAQNYGQGSQTWAGTALKVAAIAAQMPWGVIVHCGVNDVSAGRSWAAIQADMDTFRAGLPDGTKLYINEVLPWTAGADAKAADLRALNANYASWCAANGATLVPCHDAMGQLRSSTGHLDDLLAAYNYDGVHLSVPSGVSALAALMAAGISAGI
jgi:lysophospholipase L1-like esterase